LRSPIGVLMVMFQLPSTAISKSPVPALQNRKWFWASIGPDAGIAHPVVQAQPSDIAAAIRRG